MAQEDNTKTKFYDDAEKYWDSVPATINGMLGGYSSISSVDIAGSTHFLRNFIVGPKGKTGHDHALDCGAGIGRITKNLLSKVFNKVDMVDVNQAFIDEAPQYLESAAAKVDKRICCGLQDFVPEAGRYDVIWIQWVLGHLTDEHFVQFFIRCQAGLKPNGVIIVKENVASSDEPDFDKDDSSYTRPLEKLLDLFKLAQLRVLKQEKQSRFPDEIYAVYMFALQSVP